MSSGAPLRRATIQEGSMSDVQVTPQQIFDAMPAAIVPEKAAAPTP